ncbi:riboflavin synthase [Candidatus Micrarchaeota archaeon]|nr:riboflavin synthase [Candidatus Micrarchaeota archaeon]MBU1166014.1 riboflavin synthase [Candidatus Micrarchaeota archaeon]MBU1886934.1 riboflavin synthase [Candidatus Micrarchaeota archaeon]
MKIGIVDTMFSRVNMGEMALDEIKKNYPDVEIIRRTVPGVKDLPVECKRLLDAGCESCMALGMVGGAPVDQVCAHEASIGIQQVKLMTNKHVIEAFVHENEAWSEKEFFEICDNRVRKHAHNAVLIVTNPEELTKNAGKGMRQGKEDEGEVSTGKQKIRIALVVAEFNGDITEQMEESAKDAIKEADAELSDIVHVAGVFEIPLAVKKLLMDKRNNAVVSLGAVIKGETAHDELIAKTVAKKLSDLSLEFNKPATLGIIGHDVDYEGAEDRAEGYATRAVEAAVGLVKVLRA